MNMIQSRRDDDKARRREEIIDAAETLARQKGWDQVTVGSVAKQARLSRALVYIYFENKRDLHAALSDRAKDALYKIFKEAVSNHSGLDRFRAVGMAYLDFANTQPHYVEALIHFEASAVDEAQEPQTHYPSMRNNKVIQLIAHTLAEEIDAGNVRSDVGDLTLVALNMWAFTHGLIQISATRQADSISSQQLAEQAMTMIRRMLEP